MQKKEVNFVNRIFPEHNIKFGKIKANRYWSVVYDAMNLDQTERYAVKVIS